MALTALGCGDVPNVPPVTGVDTLWRNSAVRGHSVPVFDAAAVYHLDQQSHVVASVRRSDGVTLWRRTIPIPTSVSEGYGLALAGGHLVVGDVNIFGLDLATGDIQWTFTPSVGQQPGFSALSAVGDVVYSGSTTGHVYAIDARTGAEKWARSVHESPTRVFHPRVVDGVIYAGVTHWPANGPAIGGAVAIDASGAILWKTMLPPVAQSGGAVTSAVAVVGSEVIVGASKGVFFLDRATGAIRETWGAPVFGDPAPSDHRVHHAPPHLLVGTLTGMVFAFDLATRQKAWERRVFGSVQGFASDDSRAYVAMFGRFHALRLTDGAIVWTLPPGSAPTIEQFLAPPALDGIRIYLAGSLSVYALLKK